MLRFCDVFLIRSDVPLRLYYFFLKECDVFLFFLILFHTNGNVCSVTKMQLAANEEINKMTKYFGVSSPTVAICNVFWSNSIWDEITRIVLRKHYYCLLVLRVLSIHYTFLIFYQKKGLSYTHPTERSKIYLTYGGFIYQ